MAAPAESSTRTVTIMTMPRELRKPVKIPDRAAELVRTLQVRLECPRCGKRCYAARKAARKAARLLHPGTHMRKYRCGDFWHLTSMTERPSPRRSRCHTAAVQQAHITTPAAA